MWKTWHSTDPRLWWELKQEGRLCCLIQTQLATQILSALCVPMNDLESTTSSDMGVTGELEEWENSQHWNLRTTGIDCSATSTYNFNVLHPEWFWNICYDSKIHQTFLFLTLFHPTKGQPMASMALIKYYLQWAMHPEGDAACSAGDTSRTSPSSPPRVHYWGSVHSNAVERAQNSQNVPNRTGLLPF